MSHSTTFEALHIERPATPRGAILVGLLYSACAALTRRRPVQATRISEANAVRSMADRLIGSDPALAADLYAAAGRHEHLLEQHALH